MGQNVFGEAMRADARRNRNRLVAAATELILETGGEPPLDAVSRRAEVGIGTLYRHFPDRNHLLDAVARHALEGSIEAAERALAEAVGGYDALRRYMHAAVDRGVGVLNLVHPLLDDPDWKTERARVAALLDTIVQRAKWERDVRDETGVSDIVFAVIRFSRPVDIGLPRPDERALAHRHLDIYIDGLGRSDPVRQRLPEPPALERFETH